MPLLTEQDKAKRREELKKWWSDEQLLKEIATKGDGYTPEGLALLKEELIRRGYGHQDIKEQTLELKKGRREDDKQLAFGWGYLFIALMIFNVLKGILFFYARGSQDTPIGTEEVLENITVMGIASLSAYGLIKRKKWGLHATYAAIVWGALQMSIYLITTAWRNLIEHSRSLGISLMALSIFLTLGFYYLWFMYFRRRKGWFK